MLATITNDLDLEEGELSGEELDSAGPLESDIKNNINNDAFGAESKIITVASSDTNDNKKIKKSRWSDVIEKPDDLQSPKTLDKNNFVYNDNNMPIKSTKHSFSETFDNASTDSSLPPAKVARLDKLGNKYYKDLDSINALAQETKSNSAFKQRHRAFHFNNSSHSNNFYEEDFDKQLQLAQQQIHAFERQKQSSNLHSKDLSPNPNSDETENGDSESLNPFPANPKNGSVTSGLPNQNDGGQYKKNNQKSYFDSKKKFQGKQLNNSVKNETSHYNNKNNKNGKFNTMGNTQTNFYTNKNDPSNSVANSNNSFNNDNKNFKNKKHFNKHGNAGSGNKYNKGHAETHQVQFTKRLCRYYVEGRCVKGSECKFSHDGDLNLKKEVCKYYVQNTCTKGDACVFMHSQFPCKFFHTGQNCFGAENCKFSHALPLSDEGRELLNKAINNHSANLQMTEETPEFVDTLMENDNNQTVGVDPTTNLYTEQDDTFNTNYSGSHKGYFNTPEESEKKNAQELPLFPSLIKVGGEDITNAKSNDKKVKVDLNDLFGDSGNEEKSSQNRSSDDESDSEGRPMPCGSIMQTLALLKSEDTNRNATSTTQGYTKKENLNLATKESANIINSQESLRCIASAISTHNSPNIKSEYQRTPDTSDVDSDAEHKDIKISIDSTVGEVTLDDYEEDEDRNSSAVLQIDDSFGSTTLTPKSKDLSVVIKPKPKVKTKIKEISFAIGDKKTAHASTKKVVCHNKNNVAAAFLNDVADNDEAASDKENSGNKMAASGSDSENDDDDDRPQKSYHDFGIGNFLSSLNAASSTVSNTAITNTPSLGKDIAQNVDMNEKYSYYDNQNETTVISPSNRNNKFYSNKTGHNDKYGRYAGNNSGGFKRGGNRGMYHQNSNPGSGFKSSAQNSTKFRPNLNVNPNNNNNSNNALATAAAMMAIMNAQQNCVAPGNTPTPPLGNMSTNPMMAAMFMQQAAGMLPSVMMNAMGLNNAPQMPPPNMFMAPGQNANMNSNVTSMVAPNMLYNMNNQSFGRPPLPPPFNNAATMFMSPNNTNLPNFMIPNNNTNAALNATLNQNVSSLTTPLKNNNNGTGNQTPINMSPNEEFGGVSSLLSQPADFSNIGNNQISTNPSPNLIEHKEDGNKTTTAKDFDFRVFDNKNFNFNSNNHLNILPPPPPNSGTIQQHSSGFNVKQPSSSSKIQKSNNNNQKHLIWSLKPITEIPLRRRWNRPPDEILQTPDGKLIDPRLKHPNYVEMFEMMALAEQEMKSNVSSIPAPSQPNATMISNVATRDPRRARHTSTNNAPTLETTFNKNKPSHDYIAIPSVNNNSTSAHTLQKQDLAAFNSDFNVASNANMYTPKNMDSISSSGLKKVDKSRRPLNSNVSEPIVTQEVPIIIQPFAQIIGSTSLNNNNNTMFANIKDPSDYSLAASFNNISGGGKNAFKIPKKKAPPLHNNANDQQTLTLTTTAPNTLVKEKPSNTLPQEEMTSSLASIYSSVISIASVEEGKSPVDKNEGSFSPTETMTSTAPPPNKTKLNLSDYKARISSNTPLNTETVNNKNNFNTKFSRPFTNTNVKTVSSHQSTKQDITCINIDDENNQKTPGLQNEKTSGLTLSNVNLTALNNLASSEKTAKKSQNIFTLYQSDPENDSDED